MARFYTLFLLIAGTFSGLYGQTTLVVTSNLESGPGSIAEALATANSASNAANPHEINFSGLAIGERIDISDPLIVSGSYITITGDIDGDFRPDITIRASSSGISGFQLTGSNNTIAYLNIIEFAPSPNSAIRITAGTQNQVIGNFLGTDLTGTTAWAVRNFRNISIEGGSDHVIGNGTPEGANVFSNGSWGIYMNSSDNNKILGNYVGVDITGKVAIPNVGHGIELVNCSNVTIGGINPGEANIVSGNGQNGIEINGGTGNIVEGNHVGMDVSGTEAIPNSRVGLFMASGSGFNFIRNNLISANNQQGISLSNSTGDEIYGNLIGTDITGTVDFGNTSYGIWVSTNSTGAKIGDGTAGGRNIISGNSSNGILISGGTNSILGNYIGLDINGTASLGNSGGGIVVAGGVNNRIGLPNQGNVISANSYGIGVTNGAHLIMGNKIGTDESGSFAIGNNNEGIRLTTAAAGVTIGDGTADGANLISGNLQDGIIMDGDGVNSNQVRFNYIGTAAGGVGSIPNEGNGVLISGNANTNYVLNSVLAFNKLNGIEVNGSFASGTAFNLFNQNSYYRNDGKAISIINGSQNDIVPPVIVDNLNDGKLSGTSAAGAAVEIYIDSEDEGQVYLGTTFADPGGVWSYQVDAASIVTGLYNVTALQSDNGNTSELSPPQVLQMLFVVTNTNDSGGGSLRWVIDNVNAIPGKDAVIFDIPTTDPGYTNNAGEEYWTIRPLTRMNEVTQSIIIDGTGQPGTGSYKIRLDGQGTVDWGLDIGWGDSEVYGLYITNFTVRGLFVSYIGGGPSIIGASGKGNVINNCGDGMHFTLADGNTIQGNIVGLDETGTIAMPNNTGINFPSSSSSNTIGGPNPGEGNIISGNTGRAINFNAAGGHTIEGNYIGTDITGLIPLGNGVGLYLGNSGANVLRNNIISATSGVAINLLFSSNNIIQGNYIGVGSDGSTPMGNGIGIRMESVLNADNNIIGGINAGEANVIANSTQQGIFLTTDNADFNSFIGNSIYCNGGLGIDLTSAPGTGNDGKVAPEITTVTLTSVSGTGIDGDIIHVYADDTGCIPVQGKDYLGTTTVSGGTWSLTGLSLTGTEIINATATDAAGATSQFAVDYTEIQVFQGPDNTGTEIIDDQASSVDLGSEVVGTDLDFEFTIENTSWVPLNITSISAADAEFTIIGAPLTVAPRSTENFTIRLSGSTYGTFSSSINIDNDDPDETSFDFPVNGEITVDFVVTNTNDSGVGSLRFNIDAANVIAGYDVITFNIPVGDPNYDAPSQRWIIQPLTDLPALTETAFLDADTQPGTASYRIVIDGTGNASLTRGLEVNADDIEVDGFYVKGFTSTATSSGILVSGGNRALIGTLDGTDGNLISGNSYGIFLSAGADHEVATNFIGTDDSGISSEANLYGIRVSGTTGNIHIGDVGYSNLISGNTETGIWAEGVSNIIIVENLIGTDATGNSALPNLVGVVLRNTSTSWVNDNTISGNTQEGISLRGATNTSIYGNRIGIGLDMSTAVGNDIGIRGGESGNTDNNIIGLLAPYTPNIIAYNTSQGILLDDANYDFNTITGNQIYCNGAGIDLQGLGNDNISPPGITSVSIFEVSGTGVDGHTVELFRDNSNCGPLQGQEYLGSTLVSGGTWTITGVSLATGDEINVTATDENGNTSPFAYSYGEIQVFEGPDVSGTEVLDGQASIISMGSSPVGTDLQFDITVRNTSGAILGIEGISSSIPEITVSGAPVQVNPFTTQTFPITLSGATGGVFTATINIASDDPDESSFQFDVSGEITAPQPQIRVFDGPAMSFEIVNGTAQPLDLGQAYFGTAINADITVENNGAADLIVSDIQVTDPAFTFTGLPSLPATLSVGQTSDFQISLDGQNSGVFNADVIISSNDPNIPSFSFPVTGEIISAAEIAVFEGVGIFGNEIQDNGTAPTVSIEQVPNNIVYTFSIQNLGNIDLTISDITSSDPNFVVSNIPTFVPTGTGSVVQFDVTLTGAARGVFNTTITIFNDDPDESNFTFDLSGEIQSPELHVYEGVSVNPSNELVGDEFIDMGTATQNNDLVSSFTVENQGTSDLIITDISVVDPEFSVSPSNFTVLSGSIQNFTVTLDGTNPGIFTTQISVQGNDPVNTAISFTVQGEIVAPQVTIREDNQSGGIVDENIPIDVGTTPRSTIIEKVFVIENVGTQVLDVLSITIDNAAFSILNPPTSIDPGNSSSFTVVFSTEELGIQQGTVVIETNVGTFTFFVTGNVVDIVLYNVVSPNGDGIHDELKIENIEFFPNNTVYIYTRWGDTVFKVDGYNNTTNAFEGIGNQGSIGEVADGTYYYVVVYEYQNSNGETVQNTLTGFFLIKRDL